MSQEGGAPPVSLGAGGSALNSSSLLRFIRQGRSFSGHEANCCFLNTGQARFGNVSAASGLDFEDDGRAVAVVDWDLDGDLDFWIANRNGPQLRFLRNGLANRHYFVAVRLHGTKCNRDAIGARVEVVTPSDHRVRIKTLRAGDGYLGQSSKWLHFGLGSQNEVSQVVVDWPHGDRETFTGISAGQRYDLIQGTSEATVWKPPISNIELAHVSAPSQQETDTVHAFSVSRVPVPRLPYRALDGTPSEVFELGSGRPVLLNLWASWCNPCLEELADFAAGKAKLQAKGLEVVALSVDGLDGKQSASGAELRTVLQRTGFPFRTGRADAGLVEKIQLLNNYLFDLHLPLPVPTSVLIDAEGRLASLYKGKVSLERVLADVAVLDADLITQRNRTTPFPGRWHESLKSVSLVPMLDRLTAGGFLPEADDYVRRIGTARKQELLPAIARLGIAWYRQGWNDKAQKHFGVIAKIDPSFVGVQTQLGKLYEDEGRSETAVKLYREAIRRNPKSVRALNNLAWLLATCPTESIRDGAEAVKLAGQANKLTSGADPNILDTLAATLAQAGEFAQARRIARDARQLARSRGRLALVTEIEQRLALYESDRPFVAVKK